LKKSLKISWISFLSFFFVLSSCSSDDNNEPETFIKFKINGNSYLFKDIISVVTDTSLSLNGNNGQGISNPGDTQLAILLPANVQTGSFEISGDFFASHKIIFSSDPLNFDFDTATNGNMTITSTSGEFVTGTFSATVTNASGSTITLTEGAFKGFKD
jgi:hypothetical protein